MTLQPPAVTHKPSLVGETIAIGSEMLFAHRVDTNSVYIAAQLERFGVPLIAKSIVGDHLKSIKQALALGLTRAELIFLTGGLGPTEDDLTRDAVSDLLGLELIYHPEIVKQILSRFQKVGRVMDDINKRQGFVLKTAQVLENSRGTAPGQYLKFEGHHIFLLPGPPRELQPMIQAHLIPLLDRLRLHPWHRRYFRVIGLPESQVDSLVAPIYRQYSRIRSTILAGPGEIELFFLADDDGASLAELANRVTEVLGENIYATEEISLESVVGRLLTERRGTLSVAESCTGGMLGEWLTRTPGSSEFFLGGVIAYSNSLKSEQLGIPRDLLEQHGAVSEVVAEAMAEGVRKRLGSDYAISVTGIAGPDGGSAAKPVGTVFVGYSDRAKNSAAQFHFLGEREVVRVQSTRAALNLLRKELLRPPRESRVEGRKSKVAGRKSRVAGRKSQVEGH